MRPLTTSVVICAHTADRWEQICGAVASVRNQSMPCTELILVIDHNLELFQRATTAFPDAKVLQSQEAQGLSGARNTGAIHAQADIIAFLDDDAAAHEDWLKFLADSYQDPRVAGVGGLIVPRWQSARPAWLPEECYWAIGCSYLGMAPSGTPVRNLIGANMSFRRNVFNSIEGGFMTGIGRTSAGLPFGCEETEFCIRLGQQSPESILVIDHRAVVWHYVFDSRCTFSYFLTRCFAEGISKARIQASVGRDALSAERTYTMRTLPRGVLHGVRDLFHGDVAGAGRAATITAGLGLAVSGYIRGKLDHHPLSHLLANKACNGG